jgi:hypothetical protein
VSNTKELKVLNINELNEYNMNEYNQWFREDNKNGSFVLCYLQNNTKYYLGGDMNIFVSVRDSLHYVLLIQNIENVFKSVDDDFITSSFALAITEANEFTYKTCLSCLPSVSQKVQLTDDIYSYGLPF